MGSLGAINMRKWAHPFNHFLGLTDSRAERFVYSLENTQ